MGHGLNERRRRCAQDQYKKVNIIMLKYVLLTAWRKVPVQFFFHLQSHNLIVHF